MLRLSRRITFQKYFYYCLLRRGIVNSTNTCWLKWENVQVFGGTLGPICYAPPLNYLCDSTIPGTTVVLLLYRGFSVPVSPQFAVGRGLLLLLYMCHPPSARRFILAVVERILAHDEHEYVIYVSPAILGPVTGYGTQQKSIKPRAMVHTQVRRILSISFLLLLS